jgi:Ca-activated chloride channel family protein
MRSRLPLVAAAIVGVVLILALRVIFTGSGPSGDGGSNSGPADSARTGCTRVVVAASSEKAGLLQQIAQEYEQEDHRVGGRCVDVEVTSKASGAAEEALARGWNERADGPRPDVWSPAASTWLALLRQDLTRGDKPSLLGERNPSFARTPLVLAMPQPMAEALGWPRSAIGWSDVLALSGHPQGWGARGHAEWGRFKLGKTNPFLSTSGLAATVGMFVAATGRSSDLTARDLADQRIRSYVRAVERSVVHYGDTTLTFLSNLQRADDEGQGLSYVSAVAVEEKSVIDYNNGNPTGDLASIGKHPKPRVPLVAVYPKEGTLLSDNPYAVLTAPWVDDAKKAAAADFLTYLTADPAQRRFTDAGFRGADGKPGTALRNSSAVIVDQPRITLDPPAPAVLFGVRQVWTEVRKRARVLLVVDVSGSMGQPASGAQTRLELAQKSASAALADFAPDDHLGVWAFTTDISPGAVHTEVAPIAPIGPQLNRIRAGIHRLVPLSGTPLYAVTREAVKVMTGGLDPERINAIVLLTDGKNEYPEDTDLDGLVDSLKTSENIDSTVRVFSIAYGEEADLATLSKISEASRARAYDARDPATIERIFTAVVSNF